MRYLIYLITNLANGKKYVGKTSLSLANRWKQHIKDSNKRRNGHLGNAIRKYGKDCFSIIQIGAAGNNDKANEFERYYISLFDTHEKHVGYNLTMGGDGGSVTEVVRRKIGQISKQLWLTPEYRQKVMERSAAAPRPPRSASQRKRQSERMRGMYRGPENPFYGKNHDAETLARMSEIKKEQYLGEGNPFFGKTHTEEAKEKSRQWHKEVGWRGERSPRFRTDLPNEKIRELYLACGNTSEVARQLAANQGTIYNRCKKMGLV